ncbi:hypothetical protein C8R43DRAFT_1085436 [Mycena crocata]|nr:hypothetical protein C8R43DRAFT_1085436 [Mycena crocata]
MAHLSEFETALKEVVHAKRLSASKMNNLTEVALRSMQDDTQLVSILYRTHKSLQPPAKVSSLYVFDALARAARSQVVKQGLTGDINSRKGNSATFLLKVEGVLEGLFQDMISNATPESKEKTKKVLDIWSKGSTFPPAILVRLKEVVSETEKDTAMKVTSDPRSAAVTPPVVAQVPPAPALDPQATLLALLTQAANAAQANPGQTTTNTVGIAPSQQLAVLQQLALTANLGNVSQPTVQPVAGFPPSNLQRSPASHRDEHFAAGPNMGRRDSRFDRGTSQELGRNFDDRNSYRGGFRGRGRGEGRSWDDRDRYKDMNRSPPRRARRSRSRSPPSRFSGRRDRDIKPYSPPRRPSMASMPNQDPGPPPRTVLEAGKDEFGRDIRPASPSPEPPADISTPPPPEPVVRTQNVEPPPAAALTSNHDQMSLTPSVDANTSSRAPDAAIVSNKIPSQEGMENFSPATFDFTNPSSWEALGRMWQVTHGYVPSTDQLMEFIASALGGAGVVASQQQQQQQQQQQPEWNGGSNWGGIPPGPQNRRGARGRGGLSRGRGYGGNTRDGQWHSNAMGETDAIVLGGGDEEVPSFEGAGGSGGRMQQVGDKQWVWSN